MSTMIDDSFGMHSDFEFGGNVEEAPNEEANIFYKQLCDCSRPLFNESQHSKLYVAVRLSSIKSEGDENDKSDKESEGDENYKSDKQFAASFVVKIRPLEVDIHCFISSETQLTGDVKIAHFNARHIYIDLDNEDDHISVWNKQKMYIEGQLMRLQVWTPTFNLEEETPTVPAYMGYSTRVTLALL
ncbi:hypothetical protein H5410_027671 [Solanum commersonii]|uniref:DUF4283 domain-containing protein n=1 Tax=Solanum commersonii TaxID=4109 RepID=A0A9J5YZT9_SOLCO|nr:hypothetical protein H5410_027671 [Solanum commersonii]